MSGCAQGWVDAEILDDGTGEIKKARIRVVKAKPTREKVTGRSRDDLTAMIERLEKKKKDLPHGI